MRIGIIGGTFNPLHTGHLLLAETIRSDYPLDKILFVPASIPPHKLEGVHCSGRLRLQMLQTALASYPNFDVLDYEIEKGGVSYTIDTVQWLLEDSSYRKDELFLILGGDSLVELHTWRLPFEIVNRIQILVVARPGFKFDQILPEFKQAVKIIEAPLIEIASSEIRNRIRNNQSIRFWVPDDVLSFIEENGLYRE